MRYLLYGPWIFSYVFDVILTAMRQRQIGLSFARSYACACVCVELCYCTNFKVTNVHLLLYFYIGCVRCPATSWAHTTPPSFNEPWVASRPPLAFRFPARASSVLRCYRPGGRRKEKRLCWTVSVWRYRYLARSHRSTCLLGNHINFLYWFVFIFLLYSAAISHMLHRDHLLFMYDLFMFIC